MARSTNNTLGLKLNLTVPYVQDEQGQPVTAWTVFWSVTALAFNAMAQSSTTTDLFMGSRDLFRDGLSPQMSSPITCFSDVIIESGILIVCFWDRCLKAINWMRCLNLLSRQPPSSSSSSSSSFSPHPTSSSPLPLPSMQAIEQAPKIQEVLGVRLVLFIFAVLPQAIRIFSMRGVPGIQCVAALYLAALLVRTLTLLSGQSYENIKQAFRDSIDITFEEAEETPSLNKRVWLLAVHWMTSRFRVLFYMAHFILCSALLHQTSVVLADLKKPPFLTIVLDILILTVSLWIGHFVLGSVSWMIQSLFKKTWMMRVCAPSYQPVFFPLAAISAGHFLSRLAAHGRTPSREDKDELLSHLLAVEGMLALIGIGFICTILIEAMTNQALKILFNRPGKEGDGDSGNLSLYPFPSGASRGRNASVSRQAFLDSLQSSEAFIRFIRVSVANDLDFLDSTSPYAQFIRQRPDVLRGRRAWNCFAIYNVLSAATFLFVAFDSNGTSNPTWADYFG